MLFRRIAAALALSGILSLGLAACGGADNRGPPPPCPRIVTVSDAAHLTRFQGPGRDVKDVQFEAQIGDIRSSCVYIVESDNKTRIETTMQVQTVASRGPAMAAKSAQFQYFVAIAKIGTGPLARQAFDVEIALEGNDVRAQSVDELTQTIPLQSGENGDNYAIYVGLVLTPEELKFNRADSSSTIVAPSSP
ncbi:hypothetical protein [Hypericibacter sp.]|uniref:hypothetical protein n=1 Tax=Hypericibacter sp. TaxID=2705401 RepID=UPI003D6CECF3